MNLKLIKLLVGLLFIASCNVEENIKPKFFLDEKEMTQLLYEVHLSDALSEEQGNGNPKLEQLLANKSLATVLANRSIRKSSFDSLYNYYILEPQKMDKIYLELIATISKKQAELAR